MPYNLSVHAYSNLRLDASARQKSYEPGALLELDASLWEYGMPMTSPAGVWANLKQPDGSQVTVVMQQTQPGNYAANWTTKLPGVYEFVVHAEGYTSANGHFTREQIVTAGVWAGGDQVVDPNNNRPGGSDVPGSWTGLCEMIVCLLEQVAHSGELQEYLKRLGLDLDQIRNCVERHCRTLQPIESGLQSDRPVIDVWRDQALSADVATLLSTIATQELRDRAEPESPRTLQVERKPKKEGTPGNLFIVDDGGKKPKGHSH